MKKLRVKGTVVLIVLAVLGYSLPYVIPADNIVTARIVLGAYYRPMVLAGELWRLITVAFQHGSLLHLAVNCYSLYCIGRGIEPGLGTGKFLGIFFASVLGGSLFLLATGSETLAVGMSGGLYGLIAAYFVFAAKCGALRNPAFRRNALQVLLVNLAINFLPNIAWLAHLGGACTGILITLLVIPSNPTMKRNALLTTVGLCVLLTAGIVVKGRIIGEVRYYGTDLDVLQTEYKMGLKSYSVSLAKRLDRVYGTYVEEADTGLLEYSLKEQMK